MGSVPELADVSVIYRPRLIPGEQDSHAISIPIEIGVVRSETYFICKCSPKTVTNTNDTSTLTQHF